MRRIVKGTLVASSVLLLQGRAGEVEALVLNNNVAADTAAAANIFDSTNQFPNVVSVAGCTGTLINSRTILTAAHCFYNGGRFAPGAAIGVQFSPDIAVRTRLDQAASGLSIQPVFSDNTAVPD